MLVKSVQEQWIGRFEQRYEMTAEDLVNKSLTDVYEALLEMDEVNLYNPEAYIYKAVMKNVEYNFLRNKRSKLSEYDRKKTYIEEVHKPYHKFKEEAGHGSEERFAQADLSSVDHAIIRMRLEGCTHAEVRERMDISRRSYDKYMDKLRDKLVDMEFIDGED